MEKEGLEAINNVSEPERLVDAAIKENPDAASDIKKGKTKAISFLVGSIMKATRGKANPKIVTDLIKKKLGI